MWKPYHVLNPQDFTVNPRAPSQRILNKPAKINLAGLFKVVDATACWKARGKLHKQQSPSMMPSCWKYRDGKWGAGCLEKQSLAALTRTKQTNPVGSQSVQPKQGRVPYAQVRKQPTHHSGFRAIVTDGLGPFQDATTGRHRVGGKPRRQRTVPNAPTSTHWSRPHSGPELQALRPPQGRWSRPPNLAHGHVRIPSADFTIPAEEIFRQTRVYF